MRATDIQNVIQIWQNAGFKFVEIHGEELHVGNNKNNLESVGRIDDLAFRRGIWSVFSRLASRFMRGRSNMPMNVS